MKLSKKNIAIKEKYDKRINEFFESLRAVINERDYSIYNEIKGFYPGNVPKLFRPDPDAPNHPCCDHKRVFIDEDGNKVYESHPYGAGMNELKELIGWCEERGLTFTISGFSTWNPMNTIKIQFHETSVSNELERLRKLKARDFKNEIHNMLGITDEYFKTEVRDVQRAYFTIYSKIHKSPDVNVAVLVSFKFSDSLKELAMKEFIEEPHKKIVLLTVLEIINGITINDKLKELDYVTLRNIVQDGIIMRGYNNE